MLKEVRPAHTGEFGLKHEEASCNGQAGTSHTKGEKKPVETPEKETAKPAEAPAPKPAKASASKPEKKSLAPPSKAAWNDLKYQCQTLAKKGDTPAEGLAKGPKPGTNS